MCWTGSSVHSVWASDADLMTTLGSGSQGSGSTSVAPAVGVLDLWVDVETPEQIQFSYSIAGIGSRGAAAAIDAGICVASLVVLLLASVAAAGAIDMSGLIGAGRGAASTGWVLAVFVLVQFVVIWGYYVLFEGLRDGQTPGKRLMQLRVVSQDGYSVSLAASAVRNLLRVVDAMPIPLYLVGIVAALLNGSRKRVGDMVAGTIVIKEGRTDLGRGLIAKRTDVAPNGTIADKVSGTDRTNSARVSSQLSEDEYSVLALYVLRRHDLDPTRRRALAAQLSERLRDHLNRSSSATSATSAAELIELYQNEKRARTSGIASRSDTGARREQHAIVAIGMKRWNDFAAALDAARARGLDRMRAEDVSRLVAEYRDVASDLARLQTATRGRDSDALFYLGRLVARGHNLLYAQRANTFRDVLHYLTWTVPREVRRSWKVIGLAAVLLFGPAVVAYVVVTTHPSVAGELLPDEMLNRAATAAERERRGEGYVTIDEVERPLAASMIISNNVRLTYMAFALGLTAGVGTVILLVLNGVAIGSGVGVFAAGGVARVILAFVAPHGVLELTAVCIAGGGGLLLAEAILLPGDRTRGEALVGNGRRAINLILAATLILLVAGSIEGLVSPRVWPISWKLAVSATTAVLLVGYLSLGRLTRTSGREITAPTGP